MTEKVRSEPEFDKYRFIINLIIMILFGVLVLLPLLLYGYHFLI